MYFGFLLAQVDAARAGTNEILSCASPVEDVSITITSAASKAAQAHTETENPAPLLAVALNVDRAWNKSTSPVKVNSPDAPPYSIINEPVGKRG